MQFLPQKNLIEHLHAMTRKHTK